MKCNFNKNMVLALVIGSGFMMLTYWGINKQSYNYKNAMENYLTALVEKNIDAMADNCIDSRFNSAQEYKEEMKDIFSGNDIENDDIVVTDYKILDDNNPKNEKFKVRVSYLNGEIVDMDLKVDKLRKKVITGMDLETVSEVVKKGKDKYQMTTYDVN